MTWTPAFACPDCAEPLTPVGAHCVHCGRCARAFPQRGGIWRFLSADAERAIGSFLRQYRAVRALEGRRQTSIAYYKALPVVPHDDPHAGDWRIRQESYRHLLGHVLAASRPESAILDVGAGSGWLSHRMAALGHRTVAVDVLDDESDGLGVARLYDAPIVAVQADFDVLPFMPSQFDVIVFNGSLHYAPDPVGTLARANALLADGGVLVVMDSPMFASDREGEAMVDDALRRFAVDYGIAEPVRPRAGYLTFATLQHAAAALRRAPAFVPSRGPLAWRVRRHYARIRLKRAPASFGMWVAR